MQHSAQARSRPPRLVFSGLPLLLPGGILGYTENLLRALARSQIRAEFKVLIPEEYAGRDFGLPAEHLTIVPGRAPLRHHLFHDIFWQNRVGHYARKRFAESTFVSTTDFFSFSRPRRSAVVLHDALDERLPWAAARPNSPRRLLRRLQNTWARGAERVLTVSNFSREEIFKLRRVAKEKIHAAHPWLREELQAPPGVQLRREARERYRLPSRYWLYLGGFRNYKNVGRLLEAYALLKAKRKCLPLVLGGSLPTAPEATLSVNVPAEMLRLKLTADDIVCIGPVDARLLPGLYAESELYLFPSTYEGFGYPPLEAASCSASVITSNAASIPEVVGPKHACFSPDSVDDLMAAWERASADPSAFKGNAGSYYHEEPGLQRWLKAMDFCPSSTA